MVRPATTTQLPSDGEIFLDHVGWMVPDIDRAASTFKKLGFQLTPYAAHGDRDPDSGELIPMGSANRLIMLERGYLEILTPVEGVDTPVSRHLRSCIERSVGVHLIALTVANADKDAQRVAAAGFELQPTVHLRRTAEGPDGGEIEVSFTVMRARFDALPEARIQVLTHHSPDEVWQSRFLGNDLGVVGLKAAWFFTEDPEKSAEGFARFSGRDAVKSDNGSLTITLDRGELCFFAHDEAGRRLAGYDLPPPPQIGAVVLTVKDLGAARRALESRHIETRDCDTDGIVVGPDDAMGPALVLVDA